MTEYMNAASNVANEYKYMEGKTCTSPAPVSHVVVANDFILHYYSVRQYFPDALFRFYVDDAFLSFSVNSREPAVHGKSQIKDFYEKIGYLNCRSHVLAHSVQMVDKETIVILISGEMSNNDELSRRYCELFTLTQQSVDCFYVKNHMLHFQDEVGASVNENLETSTGGAQISEPFDVGVKTNINNLKSSQEKCGNHLNQIRHPIQAVSQAPQHVESTSNTNKLSWYGDDNDVEDEPESNHGNPSRNIDDYGVDSSQPISNENCHSVDQSMGQSVHSFLAVQQEQQRDEDVHLRQHESGHDHSHPSSNKPRTWANVAESIRGVAPPPPVYRPAPVQPHSVPAMSTAPGDQALYQSSGGDYGVSNDVSGSAGETTANMNRGRQNQQPRGNYSVGGNVDYSSDLFVGNLPVDVTEDEIIAFFKELLSSSDRICDEEAESRFHVQLNRANRPNTLNYAFVSLPGPESVQFVLSHKVFVLRENHRINVQNRSPPIVSGGSANQGMAGAGRMGGGGGGGSGGPRRGSYNRGGMAAGGYRRGGGGGRGGGQAATS